MEYDTKERLMQKYKIWHTKAFRTYVLIRVWITIVGRGYAAKILQTHQLFRYT